MTTFKFGFVSLQEVPQQVICYKTLSNDANCPSHLKLLLTTAYSALADKPKEFFAIKSHFLKKAKLSGTFHQRSSNVVEASYKISMLIVINKRIRRPIASGGLL